MSDLDKQLLDAAIKDDLSLVEDLIKQGADVNAKDEDRNTALIIATKHGNNDIVRTLIQNGVNVNAKYVASETALIIASKKGKNNIVETLLIDYQIEVSDKEIAILKKHNCTFTLELLAKRDFEQSLQQDIKPIEDNKTKSNSGKL